MRVDFEMIESCSNPVEENQGSPTRPRSVETDVDLRTGDMMQSERVVDADHDKEMSSERPQRSLPLKFGIDRILVTETQSYKQVAMSTDDSKMLKTIDETFGMTTADSWSTSHCSRYLALWNDLPPSTIMRPLFEIDQRQQSYRRLSPAGSNGIGLHLTAPVRATDPLLVALQQRYNSRGLVTSLTAPRHSNYSLNHAHTHMRHQETAAGYMFGANVAGLRVPQTANNSKKKRSWSRAVFSNLQRKGLEKRFEVQKYVTKPDRRQLAGMLGLTDAQVKVWFQNRRMKWRHQEEAKRSTKDDFTRHHNSTSCSRSTKSDDVINSNATGSSCSEDEDSSAEDACDVITSGNQCAFTPAHLVAPLSCPLTNESCAMPSGGHFRKPATLMSVADILDLRKSNMDCVESFHSLPAEWEK